MTSITIDTVLLGYSHLGYYVFSKNNEYTFSNLVEKYVFQLMEAINE